MMFILEIFINENVSAKSLLSYLTIQNIIVREN
jgi:hypothetical protein